VSEDLNRALRIPRGHIGVLVDAAKASNSPACGHAESVLGALWKPRLWLELDAARLGAGEWHADNSRPREAWVAAVERSDVSDLLLVLASTHPDGYLRERATRRLGDRPGRLVSAALALRAVDHVPQVRAVAREALAQRRDAPGATQIIPILLATRERQAASGVLETYTLDLPDETRRALVRSSDRATRRYALATAPLTPARLVTVAWSDPDRGCRLVAAKRALDLDVATSASLLSARPAGVRALAVALGPDQLILQHMTGLLLDRCASVRRSAQTRARQLDIDPAIEYRSHLPARTAVLGLGETGTAADTDKVLTLLGENFDMPIRRAAIHALGRLAPTEVALALLPNLLADEQPGVVREAARQLRRLRFTFTGEALDRALHNSQDWTRRAALWLTPKRGWERYIATLTLYNDANDGLREYARSTPARQSKDGHPPVRPPDSKPPWTQRCCRQT
jgi:hypothetical protein